MLPSGLCQYQVVKGCNLYESEISFICLVIPVVSTNIYSHCLCIPSSFNIPITLYDQNILISAWVYNFLELLVKGLDLIVILSRCWYMILFVGDI